MPQPPSTHIMDSRASVYATASNDASVNSNAPVYSPPDVGVAEQDQVTAVLSTYLTQNGHIN
jgi:hypothetical protein